MEKRIENELRLNENRITEERLSIIAADFLPIGAGEQATIEMECKIESMIENMGGVVEHEI